MVPWVLDLDGVIWLSGRPVPGAPQAVERLRATGHPVTFVTNNSNPTTTELVAALGRVGVDAAPHEVVSSAQVTATLVDPGERVLVCGGPGLVESLSARGAVVVPGDADSTEIDVVAVGLHRDFDYEGLRVAATAIRNGARFVASNDDATYPTPDGLVPGAGAIVAAVATAAGVTPAIAGKPYPPMATFLRARLGTHGVVVGDRPDTDGRLARALGWRFALVLTGVTSASDRPWDPTPDDVADDLAALVEREAATPRR